MKKLLLCLLVLTTQNVFSHPDCVFHHAPVGNGITKKVAVKSNNPYVSATITVKEKLDELLSLFNRSNSKNISVMATINSESSIDKPLIFSPLLIAEEINELKLQMSPSLKNALFENGRINLNAISENELKKFGSRITGLYELALRYELLIKNKKHYVTISHKDVRGYYYLQRNQINASNLSRLSQSSQKEQEKIQSALIGICRNNEFSFSHCQKDYNKHLKANNLLSYYSKYINKATHTWNSYFLIPKSAVRKDITYRNGILDIPFKLPPTKKMHDFVMTIEDYWKHSGLEIQLDFMDKNNIPNLSLKENSIAHVNQLGGNNIIMNASIDMSQINHQKVLNHEFGHVLGLPDCYIEFYDEESNAFINYQLSKTDMMCSSSGQLTPRIVEELKRVYGK